MSFNNGEKAKNIGMMWLSLAVLAMFVLPILGASATLPVIDEEVGDEWGETTNMYINFCFLFRFTVTF